MWGTNVRGGMIILQVTAKGVPLAFGLMDSAPPATEGVFDATKELFAS